MASPVYFPDGVMMEEVSKASLIEAMAASEDNLRRLYTAGARLGFGTDAGFCFSQHGSVDEELLEMQKAGMSAEDVLVAAVGGLDDVLGQQSRIAEGLAADLVVLRGDPRDDLRLIADPVAVFRGGSAIFCAADAPRELCTPTPVEPVGLFRAAGFGLTLLHALP